MKLKIFILCLSFTTLMNTKAYSDIATQSEAAINSLLSLYQTKCDSSSLVRIFANASDRIIISAAFDKKSCSADDLKINSQSKECLTYLDQNLGRRLQLELKNAGCQLSNNWRHRLAANNCEISRDPNQRSEDAKPGAYSLQSRGHCSYIANKCKESSASNPNLEDYKYICAVVKTDSPIGDSSFPYECPSASNLSTCSLEPIAKRAQIPIYEWVRPRGGKGRFIFPEFNGDAPGSSIPSPGADGAQ